MDADLQAGRLRDEIRALENDELGLPQEQKRAPVMGNSVSGKPGTRATRGQKARAARAQKQARAGGR